MHGPGHLLNESIQLECIARGQKDGKHIIQNMVLPIQGGAVILLQKGMEKEIHSRFRLFHRLQIGIAAMEIYKFIRVLAFPKMHYPEL